MLELDQGNYGLAPGCQHLGWSTSGDELNWHVGKINSNIIPALSPSVELSAGLNLSLYLSQETKGHPQHHATVASIPKKKFMHSKKRKENTKTPCLSSVLPHSGRHWYSCEMKVLLLVPPLMSLPTSAPMSTYWTRISAHGILLHTDLYRHEA